ncbi:30S ribosomal protein S16 [Candidatus Saccharibacteria bacterium]|nr:30S ribosomal protein S16 [Candidatus Saccharibacteria bacterium]
MLVIRLQRVGRKGHAQFRVVVQDSRRTPTSGKIVAQIGTYNPHTKELKLEKDRTQHYLDHGAQPSDRVVLLLQKEGIKLPSWVKAPAKQSGTIRNPEKLRRNQPKEEPVADVPVGETVAEEVSAEEVAPVAEESAAESIVEKAA